MRKRLALACALAAAGAAHAYLGQVITWFNSPSHYPAALAISADYLYVYHSDYVFDIYRVDAETGSVYGSFANPFNGYTRGLGYEYGGYLWIAWCEYPNAAMYRVNHMTGSIYSSFPVTQHMLYAGCDCQGDPTQPGTLAAIVSASYSTLVATRHTPAGSLLNSFVTVNALGDPAWDYGNNLIWFPQWATKTVYGYDTAGSLVASFQAPATYTRGACYRDGYLWLCSQDTNCIYKVHCPNIIGVEPASFGTVKALFR